MKLFKITITGFVRPILLAGVVCPGVGLSSLQAQQTFGKFTYTIKNEGVEITGYTCDEADVVIPPEIEGMPVVRIGNSAFYQCQTITSVSLPDSVTSIGTNAFGFVRNLTEISLPPNLEKIERAAFLQCNKLPSITIPASVSEIGISIFFNCSSLTEILVDPHNQVYTSADNIIFSKDMTTLVLFLPTYAGDYVVPSGVNSLQSGAFQFCRELKTVVLPEGITTLPINTFDYCSKLTSVTLPDSLTRLEYGVFSNCENLESISIPRNVDFISNTAFLGCDNLTGISVSIDNSTFASEDGSIFSKDLTELFQFSPGFSGDYVVPAWVETIRQEAFGKITGLESVVIPEGVTLLDFGTFNGNPSLQSVMLPDSLTTLESYVFANCPMLESITIPPNVESMGPMVFAYSSNLTSVYFEGNPPEVLEQTDFFAEPYPTVYYYSTSEEWEGAFASASTVMLQGEGIWHGAAIYDDGWMKSSWFDWFQERANGWIYHIEHGWETVVGESNDNVYLYDLALEDWLFTSVHTYPFLYKYGTNAGWYWYSVGGTPGERWFVRWSDLTWVQEPNINNN